MDLTTKKKIAASLRTAAKVLDGGSAYEMGGFNVDLPDPGDWPEPRGWEADAYNHRPDAFGGYDEMTYQFVGGDGSLFVKFAAPTFKIEESTRGYYQPERPAKKGSFKMEAYGQTFEGAWTAHAEIEKILAQAPKWGEQQKKKMNAVFEKLGGRNWSFDEVNSFEVRYSLEPRFIKETGGYGDESVTVTIEEPADIVAGEPGAAEISMNQGYSYSGARRPKEVSLEFRGGVNGIKKVLKQAEKLFLKHQENQAPA